MVIDAWDNDLSVSFRYLLAFTGLDTLVPPSATVQGVALNLSLVNWGSTVTLQGCYLTKPSQDVAV